MVRVKGVRFLAQAPMLNRCKQYQQLTLCQFICNCIFLSTVSYHRITGY